MEESKFIFRCRPLTGKALLPQISWALEKRTERLSREEHPEMWRHIDRLRAVAAGLPRTSRQRKLGSVICLLLGVLVLVPGIAEQSVLMTVAGLAGVAVGIGGFLVKRNPKKSGFDLAAEKLLSAWTLIGDDQIRVLFDEEAMTIEQDHVGERIPYGEITLAVETQDIWLMLFGDRAMILVKEDLDRGTEDFRAFLQTVVPCECQ